MNVQTTVICAGGTRGKRTRRGEKRESEQDATIAIAMMNINFEHRRKVTFWGNKSINYTNNTQEINF